MPKGKSSGRSPVSRARRAAVPVGARTVVGARTSAGPHSSAGAPTRFTPGSVLNQTAEYALRVAVHLASKDPEKLWRAAELAEHLNIPANYLSKILHQLTRAELLESRRGRDGGFRLARPAHEITLADVAGPFDHHATRRPGCLLGVGNCDNRNPCALHHRWRPLSDSVTAFFAETYLDTLVRTAR